jgi:hypothetical protein
MPLNICRWLGPCCCTRPPYCLAASRLAASSSNRRFAAKQALGACLGLPLLLLPFLLGLFLQLLLLLQGDLLLCLELLLQQAVWLICWD